MEFDTKPGLSQEQRMAEILVTLRRICLELDALARATRLLLEANNCRQAAIQLMNDFEDIRSATSIVEEKEQLEMQERDTLIPSKVPSKG